MSSPNGSSPANQSLSASQSPLELSQRAVNLLSGEIVFVTAVVMKPPRYVAVDRDALRALLFDDGPLSDLVRFLFDAVGVDE